MARCPFAEWIPSPNHSTRSGSVLGTLQHSTVGAWAPSLAELTRADTSPVSAHFLIGLDGRLAQLVDTDRVAWHAMSANDRWLGIEHVDNGNHADPVRTLEQYATSARLNRWLADMYDYPIDASTIERHRTFVATACPSGLDVERIIIEAQGGSMAEYVEIAVFEAWRKALQKQLEDTLVQRWEGDRITNGLRSAAGVPLSVRRAARLLIPPLQARKVKRVTRAQVRAGHGR